MHMAVRLRNVIAQNGTELKQASSKSGIGFRSARAKEKA